MTKINLLLLSLVLLGSQALAQEQLQYDAYIKNYSPLTPNSASLGKYGDVPVSLYTGVPDIQVPLYEIDVKGFKLPISLSYHAGGIKVEEIASWVGMGWSLNAGGVINRNQRGISDESMLSRLDQTKRNKINAILASPSSPLAEEYYQDFYLQKFDTEADIYNYNFAGHSGKFFSDLEGKFYTMPANKFKFAGDAEILYGSLDQHFYGRWKVKDNEGVSYVFGKSSTDVIDNNAAVEIVENLDSYDGGDVALGDPNYTDAQADRSINSWYLREIILPSGEKIEFSYEAYSYTVIQKITETYRQFDSSLLNQYVTRYRKALRLKEIVFPNGKVVFTKSTLRRKDLFADYPLEKMEIFEKTGTNQYSLLKYFKLNTNNEAASSEDPGFRLKLKSVTEYDKNNIPKPPYAFEYLEAALPPRDSNAQDIWGYYNGATGNTTLVPVHTEGAESLPGGLRHVDPGTIKNGTLVKMTYPTGGYTTFDYENHKAIVTSPAARSLLTKVLKGKPTPKNVYARIIGVPEVFSQPFTIANPNTTLTLLTLVYSFTSTDPLYYQYTQQLYQNQFIEVALQQKDGSGNFNDFETNFPSLTNGQQMNIANGTYRIRIAWKKSEMITRGDIATFELRWTAVQDQTVGPTTVVDVGGLRIKEVKHFNAIDNKVKKTAYSYLMGSESSGLIRNVPVFFYKKNVYQISSGHLTTFVGALHRSSVSQSPLLTSQGGIVGYQKVTVSEEEEGGTGINGSTVHLFTSPLDFSDRGVEQSFAYPFPPSTNYDWMLGLPKETTYYKLEGVTLKPVKKDVFTYINFVTPDLPDFKINKSIKVYLGEPIQAVGTDGWVLLPKMAGYVYDLPNGMPFLSKKTTSEYDASGNVTLTRTTDYTLSNKALQTATESTSDSKGETWTTYNTYASDLYSASASGTDALAIKNLVENHNKKNDLIEKYTVKTNALNEKSVVSGTLYKYGPTIPLPTEVNALELISPLALSSFTPAVLNSSRQLQVDSRYKPLVNYAYDPASYNIVRQARTNGPNTGMLWGYNNSFPIATAVNAANNEIFYQDFEQGGFTAGTAHTGKYYGPDNYQVSYTRPAGTTRSYVISYWYLDGGVWKFSGELDYTGPSLQLALGTAVDDVRISPKDALMTTYTYDPLTGVTSVTDAKGLTQYYNYDSYGRLSIIKNALGEIVKKYDYHYQGQPLN